jgi:hypothetical protein
MRFLKMLAAAVLVAAWSCSAFAQSTPGWTFNFKPTTAQWNNAFALKQDLLGYTAMNVAGGVFTGRVVFSPPGATLSGFNIGPGIAPASPVEGDWWQTATGVFGVLNGGTVEVVTVPAAAPTIASGFGGGSPAISASNGPIAWRLTIGTASGTTGVLTLPAAPNGWNCYVVDLTTISAANFLVKQTASTTTSATFGGFSNAGVAATWVAADVLSGHCVSF